MPKAVDKHPQSRGTGNALFNPLRQGVSSYEDPLSAIGDDAHAIGGQWNSLFSAIGSIFGLPSPQEILAGVANGVGTVIGGAVDFLGELGNRFGRLIGGLLDPFQVPILDPSKILNLPGLFENVVDIATGIFNGWFGGGGSGTAAEVTYTIEKIKDAVINGYNVHVVTSDEVNWVVPSPLPAEFNIGAFSGGQDGNGGSSGGGNGGAGGLHGSYVVNRVDLTGIAALDTRIGTAGNLSYVRVHNATPHTGAVVAQSAAHGSPGGMSTPLGYSPSASIPGSGGKGSDYNTGNGTAGSPSLLAAGGARGATGIFGSSGQPGDSVSAGAAVKCGGGGGGGGGAASVALNTGGKGGAGGYPGGGGGGGGASNGAAAGGGGPGAPGMVIYYYK
ncbi:hypothetical protein [Mycolicibacterium canariasense]|uniref:hypothetical protein n=1 Tax=Mycolicibacterium canariasense TaxID=228230 RepID=UPI0032D57138